MKKTTKTLLLLFMATIASLTSYAQSSHSFDIRLYGGTNIVQLSTDDGTKLIDGVLHRERVKGRPGVQFGVQTSFGQRFFVQPGLQYTTILKDFELVSTVDGSVLKDETTISLVSIPLRAGFKLINPEDEKVFNVRVFGGIEGHHVLDVNHDKKSGAQGNIDKDDFTNLIVNADLGMGVDVLFLFADLGYQLGLSSILSDDDVKANSFYVNLGVKIGF